jgi:hypothetical protein
MLASYEWCMFRWNVTCLKSTARFSICQCQSNKTHETPYFQTSVAGSTDWILNVTINIFQMIWFVALSFNTPTFLSSFARSIPSFRVPMTNFLLNESWPAASVAWTSAQGKSTSSGSVNFYHSYQRLNNSSKKKITVTIRRPQSMTNDKLWVVSETIEPTGQKRQQAQPSYSLPSGVEVPRHCSPQLSTRATQVSQ